ncbi:tripartite tricarboxylate transporter permease [Candidatus Woesearchaeota archaeon]|nr:tripartite tricarboxylate transporter permease [Candidatus Woesearchaeota archaeon]
MVVSYASKINIPAQRITNINIPAKEIFKATIGSTFSGLIFGFLPASGSSQAAILASKFTKNSNKSFLFMVGFLNTFVMMLSFVAFYTISKTRNGAAVAISQIMEKLSFNNLILFFGVALLVGSLSFLITLKVAKVFSQVISKINYSLLVIFILSFILLLTFFISGILGLLVLLIATFVGLIPISKNLARINLMGCLVIPVIFYFI